MKKIILLIFIVLSLNCNKKMENVRDIVFEIENIKIKSEDILEIKIINRTNKNYFIILDTCRIYDYLTLNYKVNNSILLKPKVFTGRDSIKLKINFYANKLVNKYISELDCIKQERQYTQKIINDVKKLANVIIVQKNSVFKFKIPFNSNFYDCSRKYSYSLKKSKKYFLKLEYKMDEKFINEIVERAQLKKLKIKEVEPYFEKILSNKVSLTIE